MSTYVHHKPYLTLNIGGASHLVNGLYPSYGMVWINYVYIYIYTMNYKPLTKWDAQHGFVKMGHPSMSWRNKIVLQSNWPWPEPITYDEPTGAPPEGEIHGFPGPYISFLFILSICFPSFSCSILSIVPGFFHVFSASKRQGAFKTVQQLCSGAVHPRGVQGIPEDRTGTTQTIEGAIRMGLYNSEWI